MFERFVAAVQEGDEDAAWALYAASLPGQPDGHNPEYGCSRLIFGSEFPKLQNLFRRTAPFEVLQSFRVVAGSTVIELQLRGADGTNFLATLVRVQPYEPYRLQLLNSGQAASPGGFVVPPPLDEPQGGCGLWAGPR